MAHVYIFCQATSCRRGNENSIDRLFKQREITYVYVYVP